MYLEPLFIWSEEDFHLRCIGTCPATSVTAALSDMFDKTEKSKKNQGISLVLSEIWGLFSLGQKYRTFLLEFFMSILDRQFLVSGYFWV